MRQQWVKPLTLELPICTYDQAFDLIHTSKQRGAGAFVRFAISKIVGDEKLNYKFVSLMDIALASFRTVAYYSDPYYKYSESLLPV